MSLIDKFKDIAPGGGNNTYIKRLRLGTSDTCKILIV